VAIERGEAQKDPGISGLWRSGAARYRCDLSPKRCGVTSCTGHWDEHRAKIWSTHLSSDCKFKLIRACSHSARPGPWYVFFIFWRTQRRGSSMGVFWPRKALSGYHTAIIPPTFLHLLYRPCPATLPFFRVSRARIGLQSLSPTDDESRRRLRNHSLPG
jgi:hypothetical protein